MKKTLWILGIVVVLLAIVWNQTSRPAKPGSFAWEWRTVIWFWRQGIWDVGLNVDGNEVSTAGWIVGDIDHDNISFVTNSIQIIDLRIEGGDLVDLSPISTQTSLRSLKVSNCPVQDITPLANLHQLLFLNLSGTSITAIDSLKRLNHLIDLDVSNTRITDVSPLSGLFSLSSLSLSHTAVTNLLPLKNLTSLKLLEITGIACRDFQGIPWENLEFIKLTAQGPSPWKNVQDLYDRFKGHLIFSFYPNEMDDYGYSFYSREYAFRHFNENNGTENAVSVKPFEPDVPFNTTTIGQAISVKPCEPSVPLP